MMTEPYNPKLPDGYSPEAILADPTALPIHKAYARINIDVRDNGTPWVKCPNCGEPFVKGRSGATDTFCSNICEEEFLDYLDDPDNPDGDDW